jgi:glutaconate CoA-transferase subunit B
MACVIARALREGERVGVGVNSPIPAAAVLLARRTHAPRLRYRLPGVPGADPFLGSWEFFSLAQRGRLDVFFLSGVQIDQRGWINLHVLGEYERPRRRFSGAFGSAVLYPLVPRVILFRTEHSPRVFVPRLDFVTAAGVPDRVVTPLAVLGFDRARERLVLDSYHPGQSLDSVRTATGFELPGRPVVRETTPPTAEELRLLREEVYPLLTGVYPAFVARMGGGMGGGQKGRSAGAALPRRAEQHRHDHEHDGGLDDQHQIERLAAAQGAADDPQLGREPDGQADGGRDGAHADHDGQS